ncbi:MAG: hypothetical protein WC476_01055 [Phycisphaerae bacterium]|jgi:hypothetical protein
MVEIRLSQQEKDFWEQIALEIEKYDINKLDTKSLNIFLSKMPLTIINCGQRELLFWEQRAMAQYTYAIRAIRWWLGDKSIFTSEESRILRCSKCVNFKECSQDENAIKLCLDSLKKMAVSYRSNTIA